MKVLRYSTQIHKWVALVIGLQVLFWVGGGLVMTAIPIETVRSEHRFQKPDYPAFAIDALIPVQTAATGLSAPIDKAELRHTPRGPAWVFTPKGGELYLTILPDADFHWLKSGHFAIEDCGNYIADEMKRFYDETVAGK